MLPYVKRHGRPNFPKVVSSCYRAGNWEWVNMTHDRTKDPSPLKGKKHVHFRRPAFRIQTR